jgi:TolA-binding protein
MAGTGNNAAELDNTRARIHDLDGEIQRLKHQLAQYLAEKEELEARLEPNEQGAKGRCFGGCMPGAFQVCAHSPGK